VGPYQGACHKKAVPFPLGQPGEGREPLLIKLKIIFLCSKIYSHYWEPKKGFPALKGSLESSLQKIQIPKATKSKSLERQVFLEQLGEGKRHQIQCKRRGEKVNL
jgi:hypothetical protein